MNTRNVVVASLLGILLCPALAWLAGQRVQLPPTSTQQAMKTAEVMDADGDGVGSCWPVAAQDGLVAWLTCGHVASFPVPVAVQLQNGDRWPVLHVMENPLADVALLWTRDNPARPMQPVPLAGGSPSIGTPVLIAGFPMEIGFWLAEGLVGSTDAAGTTWCSVPIYYGCSGGPALVNGRAVGVAMGIYIDRQRGVHNGPELRGMPVSTISALIFVDQFRDWLADCLARDPIAK